MKDTPKKVADKEKYFHYNTDGHWKRNCLLYLESLKTKNGDKPSEDMLVESNLMIFSISSWVLDSNFSIHICTSMQDLVDSRGLRHGEMIFRIDNGVRIAAEAIGTYPLRLPSDFRLMLKYCYYVLVASQNLIFVSILA